MKNIRWNHWKVPDCPQCCSIGQPENLKYNLDLSDTLRYALFWPSTTFLTSSYIITLNTWLSETETILHICALKPLWIEENSCGTANSICPRIRGLTISLYGTLGEDEHLWHGLVLVLRVHGTPVLSRMKEGPYLQHHSFVHPHNKI
jgi:hypothetical protein